MRFMMGATCVARRMNLSSNDRIRFPQSTRRVTAVDNLALSDQHDGLRTSITDHRTGGSDHQNDLDFREDCAAAR